MSSKKLWRDKSGRSNKYIQREGLYVPRRRRRSKKNTEYEKKPATPAPFDPDAEGVLPVCVGQATKLADYIMAERKSYRAEITFGAETTTQDASGEVIEKYDFRFDENALRNVLKDFIGRRGSFRPCTRP